MHFLSTEEKIQRHMDYWEGRPQKRPLTIVRTGDWFFSREFKPNLELLRKGRPLDPHEIDVEAYLPDYDRMYETLETLPTDMFFAADPCTGFPWIEGIMGAKITGEEGSFFTHPVLEDVEDLEDYEVSLENNPWYDKYLEFVRVLTEHSQGRYPVGEPIMRGASDTVGALIGQENMACGLMTDPDIMHKAFNRIVDVQRKLIDDSYKLMKPFHGGYSFGFYHIWAPEKVMWYQEDLSALMAPKHFEEFLLETSHRYLEGYDYTLMHLHPLSFRHLDLILTIDELKVVQINKDVGGPNVHEMVPQFRKVLEKGKNLAIGMGRVDKDDIDAIMDELPRERVAINFITEKPEEAMELIEYMDRK